MLKVGDRVKLLKYKNHDSDQNPIWGGSQGKIAGTIRGGGVDNWRVNDERYYYDVKWDNGIDNGGYLEGENIVLIVLLEEFSEDPPDERLFIIVEKTISKKGVR